MTEPLNDADDLLPSYTAQLPSATLEAEQEYPRGTILNLNVQVRVIGFTENEDRKGNLIHKHNLALEEVSIIDFLTPAQRKALIAAAEAEAEAAAARLAAGARIPEESHIEDELSEPSARETVAIDDDSPDLNHVSDQDDDDPEHSWMDEDVPSADIDAQLDRYYSRA